MIAAHNLKLTPEFFGLLNIFHRLGVATKNFFSAYIFSITGASGFFGFAME